MIEEFKDILEKYFEKIGQIINRDKIIITKYEEIDNCIVCCLSLSFLENYFYKIIYYKNIDEFTLEECQIKKSCRITRK